MEEEEESGEDQQHNSQKTVQSVVSAIRALEAESIYIIKIQTKI